VLLSATAWVYLAYYVMPLLGWQLVSMKLSFFAALVGASIAFLLGRSSGRFRRIFYEPFFAGYLDLLIVLIPLAAIYLFVLKVFIGDLPEAKYIVEQMITSPFPMISAWVFGFTVFKTLNRMYEGAYSLVQNSRFSDLFSRRKPAPPTLRDKVDVVLSKLEAQRQRMAQFSSRAEERTRDLFQRCVQARMEGNEEAAKIYAEECSQNRKITQTLLSSQMALDAVVLRLETIKQLGDIAVLLKPTTKVVRSLGKNLSGIMPEVSEELGKLVEEMSGVTGEMDLPTNIDIGAVEFKDDTQRILADAAVAAKVNAQDTLPEIPPRH